MLHDFSLKVKAGQTVALVGETGSGKSTIVNLVCRFYEPTEGAIRIDGVDMSSVPAHRRGAVIVFQELRLFPHRNVADNIAFPLKMQGVDKKNRRLRVEELLEQIQMTGMADRRISQLSGGQQQRVALARALAAGPRLLLLDEPFSSLDEELRGEMRSLVLRLHREHGMTTVLVTHDKEDARALADRVALMSAGRILRVGAPEELCP